MSAFDSWSKGSEIAGGLITRVFSHSSGRYIIYELNDSKEIVYDSTGDIGRSFAEIQLEWHEAKGLLSSDKEREKYIKSFANVLRVCLEGNPQVAKDKLHQLRLSVHDYKTVIGRIQYSLSAICFAAIIGCLALIGSEYVNPSRSLLLKMIASGVIGGTLSVMLRLGRIQIEITSGNEWIHIILGGTRALIAAFSSVAIFLMMKAGFLLGVLSDTTPYVFYALALIGGFSETYIPNLMDTVESNHT